MIAPTWLRTIAPSPTPIAPQSAIAGERAEEQQRRLAAVEREVMPRPARMA